LYAIAHTADEHAGIYYHRLGLLLKKECTTFVTELLSRKELQPMPDNIQLQTAENVRMNIMRNICHMWVKIRAYTGCRSTDKLYNKSTTNPYKTSGDWT